MSISNALNQLITMKKQTDSVVEARAILQKIQMDVREAKIRLQEIADSGSFETIDSEIKAALVKGHNIVRGIDDGFEDAVVKELLNWKP